MVKLFKYLTLLFVVLLNISIVAMDGQKLGLLEKYVKISNDKLLKKIAEDKDMVNIRYMITKQDYWGNDYEVMVYKYNEKIRTQFMYYDKDSSESSKITNLINEYTKDWGLFGDVQEEMLLPEIFSNKILFSPCSNYLLTLRPDGTIRMFAIREPHYEHGFLGNVNTKDNFATAVAFSPDGKYIATGNNDGTLNILDYNLYIKGYLLKAHSNDDPELRRIEGLAYTPDSKYLLSACSDSNIKVWNIENINDIQCLQTIKTNVVPNKDDKQNNFNLFGILNGQADPNEILNQKILNATGNRLFTAFSISNDGKYLASASSDLSLKIWDLKDMTNIKVMDILKHNHSKQIHSLVFSQSDQHLISGSDDVICVNQVLDCINNGLISKISIAEVNKIIVDYAYSQIPYILAKSEKNKLTAFALQENLFAFPKSNTKSILSNYGYLETKTPSVSIRDFSDNLEKIQREDIGIDIEFLGDIDNCKAIAFSPNGKFLAVICSSNKSSLIPVFGNAKQDYYYLKVFANINSDLFKKLPNTSSNSWCTVC